MVGYDHPVELSRLDVSALSLSPDTNGIVGVTLFITHRGDLHH
jgi:hypothetical protein